MTTDANPDLDVRLVASQGLANFQSDGVDIAVRQGRPPFGPGLVAEPLFFEAFYAVCSPALLSGEHALRTPDDLGQHVLLHDAHGLWPLFMEEVFGDKPRPESRTMNFSQTSLALDAALAGQGVALASDLFVEDELAAGRLCRPFDETIKSEFGYFIVMPRARQDADYVRRMRDWLITQR